MKFGIENIIIFVYVNASRSVIHTYILPDVCVESVLSL